MGVVASSVGGCLAVVEVLVGLSDYESNQFLPGRKFLVGLIGEPSKSAVVSGRAR